MEYMIATENEDNLSSDFCTLIANLQANEDNLSACKPFERLT
jgi:hypothetical protein